MTTQKAVNLFIPRTALTNLSIPPFAVTDGSINPEWVDMPCLTAWAYARPTILRLPLDAETAPIAHHWIRFHRLERTALRPAYLALGATSLVMLYLSNRTDPKLFGGALALLVAAWSLLWWARRTDTHLTLQAHPETFARSGVHIPAVPHVVAEEWVRLNAQVRMTDEIPVSGQLPALKILLLAIVGTIVAINLLPDVPASRIVFAAIAIWALAGGFLTALRPPASVRRSRRT